MSELVSSHSALMLAMGVSAYLGLLHLWFARGGDRANVWVAVWAGLAVVFQAGRLAQITTRDPGVALHGARISVAMAPLMIGALLSFARGLFQIPASRRTTAAFWAANGAAALLIAATPLAFPEARGTRLDPFGRPFLSAPASPWIAALGLYIAGALVWMTLRARHSSGIQASERRFLLGSILAYALLGVESIASAMRLTSLPVVAEYGPFAMAVGLSYLLVSRRRRLEDDLQSLVLERTRELEASEARSRGLIENAPIGVFACDARGVITLANPLLARLVGATPERMRGGDVLASERAREMGIEASLRRCLERGLVVVAEHRFEDPRGRILSGRVTMAPLRGPDGAVEGALGLVEDVTERRALEEHLRHSQKLESVGQLAAGIAHEINNPMAWVRTNLGVLRKEWAQLRQALADRVDLTEALAECGELIAESQEGVDRTVAIVHDMREMAHGGHESREPTALNPLVEACVRIASTRGSRTARIRERYAELPAVPAAQGQLRQVLLNLIVNALEAAGEHGSVEVETRAAPGAVQVIVRDDGPGVPEAIRERIFDPFFTTKPAGSGTGLGLYVSYQIVRAHGGSLELAAEPGPGASFVLTLPLADAAP